MLFKKLILLSVSILFTVLSVFINAVFILPLLIAVILLFNETDFLYYENPEYNETDLSRLMAPEAGSIEIEKNSEKAIIFVHGFPSCPATFRYVAPLAERAGYDVFAPLLPGFGTCNDDFVKSNFNQWFSYLTSFYLDKRKRYKKVYIVGLSMGGALTLKLAEKFSDTNSAPNGISITAAPVFLNSLRYGIIKTWLLYFIRFFSWFIKHIDKKSKTPKNLDDNHSEWIGYRGIFPRQTYSFKMAIERIRADLNKITIPIIAFHVPEDRTVNYKNFPYIEKKISSRNAVFKTLEYKGWNNTSHCLFIYESIREKLMKDILSFFKEIENSNGL